MEAIRKKVQNMKVEKDNLCDRSDAMELVGASYWRDRERQIETWRDR